MPFGTVVVPVAGLVPGGVVNVEPVVGPAAVVVVVHVVVVAVVVFVVLVVDVVLADNSFPAGKGLLSNLEGVSVVC